MNWLRKKVVKYFSDEEREKRQKQSLEKLKTDVEKEKLKHEIDKIRGERAEKQAKKRKDYWGET